MSVQFGKCNFDGKPVDPHDLDEARPVLAPYGPDGEGSICKDNFGILYRAFHTTRESRWETQPYVSKSGVVITWDGRLDNRKDLIARLAGELSPDSTDLEIVAEAYDRWGTETFRELIGDWALSGWNPGDQSLVLAKDFVGTRQLYYARARDKITWCTILDPLVLLARHPFKLEEEYLAGWLSFFPAPHLTPYVGIRAVPPSSFVRIGRRTERVAKYWDLDSAKRIRYRVDSEYEEHFRAVFSESVRRRLRSDLPILAELSGGMDSSSIVCMADAVMSRGTSEIPRLDTVSYYTDAEPNWDERPFFGRVEAQRGRVGCHIEVRAEDAFRIDFDMSRLAATPSAGSCPSAASQQFTRLLEANHNRILLSGIGGDEFTGGVSNPIPELADLLVELQLGRLAHQLKAWALDKRKPWLHLVAAVAARFCSENIKLNRADVLAPWLNLHFARRNRHALRGYLARWNIFGSRPSVQDHIGTLRALQRQLASDSLSCDPPFEKRYPYLDRNFLEFICAIPPDQLIRPGRRRSLMRRALAGCVPQEVLSRKRKGHVARGPMVGVSTNFSRLSSLCQNMRSAWLGIADEKATSALLLKVKQGLEIPMIPFMRTLAIEWWLRNLESFGIVQPDRAETRNTLRVLAQEDRQCW
jgi:asparagine synthase (glutamine-hydrolysing)